MNTQATVNYAGFWDRFAAFVADMIVLVLIGAAIVALLEYFRVSFGFEAEWSDDTDRAFGLVIGWLYFAGLESSRIQATIGKLGIGIIVAGTEGHKITFGQASWRCIAKLIS